MKNYTSQLEIILVYNTIGNKQLWLSQYKPVLYNWTIQMETYLTQQSILNTIRKLLNTNGNNTN